jgi:hypothetical protein
MLHCVAETWGGAWRAYGDGRERRHGSPIISTTRAIGIRTFERQCDAKAFLRRRESIPAPSRRIDPLKALLSIDELLALPTAWTGIYFLNLEGSIQYIGQSSDVHARIREHTRGKRIKFDRAVWIERDVTDLDYLEAAYIKQCRPPLNRGIYRSTQPPITASSPAANFA